LLFGGCFGGNITLVGSTANIVALGILEKEKNIHMTFFRWFWIGLTVGVITTLVVWATLLFVPIYH
jgi:Na+/H+ antiporter NhaD/arsenite permease-like protein